MTSPRILIIDDNEGDLVLLETVLQLIGDDVTVETSTDAENTLAELRGRPSEHLPCVILLDLNMPGLHGHEFLRAAQAHERLKEVPVLILSSSEAPSDVRRSRALGAHDHLVKPSGFAETRERLLSLRSYWLGEA